MTARAVAEAGAVSFQDVSFNGAVSVSQAYDLPGKAVSIALPATARGTKYFIQGASSKGGTMVRVQNNAGNSISVTATTRTLAYMSLEPATTFGVRYFRIESNSAQAATVTIEVGYIR